MSFAGFGFFDLSFAGFGFLLLFKSFNSFL
jgi:hypothetical protein